MNFDNQGIVSGTFLRQRWVLLLVDGAIYFTETFYKWHCITMGYTTTPPQKYWNYTKINAWEDEEVWTWEEKVGKATKCFDQMGILLMGDGIFLYIRGRGVIIIKVFPWQFLIKIWPKIIVITLNIKLFCCKNHKSNHCRCSVKEHVFKETPTQVLSCETCEI